MHFLVEFIMFVSLKKKQSWTLNSVLDWLKIAWFSRSSETRTACLWFQFLNVTKHRSRQALLRLSFILLILHYNRKTSYCIEARWLFIIQKKKTNSATNNLSNKPITLLTPLIKHYYIYKLIYGHQVWLKSHLYPPVDSNIIIGLSQV